MKMIKKKKPCDEESEHLEEEMNFVVSDMYRHGQQSRTLKW